MDSWVWKGDHGESLQSGGVHAFRPNPSLPVLTPNSAFSLTSYCDQLRLRGHVLKPCQPQLATPTGPSPHRAEWICRPLAVIFPSEKRATCWKVGKGQSSGESWHRGRSPWFHNRSVRKGCHPLHASSLPPSAEEVRGEWHSIAWEKNSIGFRVGHSPSSVPYQLLECGEVAQPCEVGMSLPLRTWLAGMCGGSVCRVLGSEAETELKADHFL